MTNNEDRHVKTDKSQHVGDVEEWESGEWLTVETEAADVITFEEVGESLTAAYLGVDHIVPPNGRPEDEFDRHLFRTKGDQYYAINDSYQLTKAMAKVNVGEVCRVTLKKLVPTSKGNPLKSYRIEVKR